MKIWIDADAAPRDVREVTLRAADRVGVPVVLVANRRIAIPPAHTSASAVVVAGGPDVADAYIADHAEAGDIAITADIPLASILVGKGVRTVDPRGEEYSAETVGERLSMRDFMDGLRGAGVETGGARPFGPREKQAFANSLDRILSRALRGQ